MSPEERDLIQGLFDRMRGYGRPEKDMQAEQLINQSMRSNPDAGYMLVQSVLVQDQALQQADARIQELEARNQELEDYFARQQPQQQQPASGGGFLGGLFGGGRQQAPTAQPMAPAPRGATSVPASGARPWGTPQAQQPSAPWGNQPAPQAPMAQQAQAQQRSGGGFMKTAMATAAGVAGGMILADSIRGMMNNGSGSGSASANQPGGNDSAGTDFGNTSSQDTGYTDAANNDPGNYEPTPTANYDGADFPSDGGGGGFDMDI
jgi:uncharacterized protein